MYDITSFRFPRLHEQDVLAQRKNSGTVTGDIRVNGFRQEAKSFRRCSGYVEQFDVQAPELTVRETVLYSGRLRLASDDPSVSYDDRDKVKFVDQVLQKLELEPLADCLVGNILDGGLSFEQRKRLSIAVELAASPSIIFLDEVSIKNPFHVRILCSISLTRFTIIFYL